MLISHHPNAQRGSNVRRLSYTPSPKGSFWIGWFGVIFLLFALVLVMPLVQADIQAPYY